MSICKLSTTNTSEKQTTLTSYIRQTNNKSPHPTAQLKHDISNLIWNPTKRRPIWTQENQKDITSIPSKQCTGITTTSNQCTGKTVEQKTNPSKGITSYLSATSSDDANSTPSRENTQLSSSLVNNIVEPLIQEMRVLKDSVHNDYV